MAGFDDPAFYGERWADVYDERHGYLDPAPAVEFLAGLAGAGTGVGADAGASGAGGGGRVLELAVGTGRVALPLAARGIAVEGVDASEAMVARLRAKPGGDAIGVTIGDFATTPVAGTFRLAYLVFNTIMNLTTQDAQVACFGNVAAHLEPGGCFVVEVMIPDLRRLPPEQTAVMWQVGPASCAFDVYDVATQAMSSNYFTVDDGRGEYFSIPFRYVWPAELDLMARLAGLRLRERWDGWNRAPFTSESRQHVSVWEKPAS